MTLNLHEKGDRWRYSGCGCRTEVELRKDTWLDKNICALGKSHYLYIAGVKN